MIDDDTKKEVAELCDLIMEPNPLRFLKNMEELL